jgi:hypothetical protein
MKVTIAEASGFGEMLMAAGLAALLGDIPGVRVEGAQPGSISRPEVAAPSEARLPIAAPAVEPNPPKRRIAGMGKRVKPSAAKPEPGGHVTIRQRILALMRAAPSTARDVVGELAKQGITSSAELAGQHCYLMTKGGLLARDEDLGGWRITAKGEKA